MLDPSRIRDPITDRLATLRDDERAIEGLPVRLVVSLVVGAACLSVMLNLVNGVGSLAASELDVQPRTEVVETGPQDLTLQVVDAEGGPVSGATVVVDGGTASVDGVATATTGADGNATVSVEPTLGANQERGTLSLDVKPPAGGSFVDRRENSHVLVIRP
ncbi:hypothetical protein JCM30237_15190 [Halolamina litorea]|uniref:Carboxypeptidase regulatory-like domain-containing protein n=1 Tax=Halolamina litorea TaxID=1515593 RepID=A0ABD6BMW1_9EURY|nr:carboxypeptidase regulatory-like domain-containing protein [Halolamina litorea]